MRKPLSAADALDQLRTERKQPHFKIMCGCVVVRIIQAENEKAALKYAQRYGSDITVVAHTLTATEKWDGPLSAHDQAIFAKHRS